MYYLLQNWFTVAHACYQLVFIYVHRHQNLNALINFIVTTLVFIYDYCSFSELILTFYYTIHSNPGYPCPIRRKCGKYKN